MKPTVYIETTIPSLLTALPSCDVEIAGQQIATREWWEKVLRFFQWNGLLSPFCESVLAPKGPEILARCKRVFERSAWSVLRCGRALEGRRITIRQRERSHESMARRSWVGMFGPEGGGSARIHRPVRGTVLCVRYRGRHSQTRLPPANFPCPCGATRSRNRHTPSKRAGNHNSIIEDRLPGICESMEVRLPTLCTPPELMTDCFQS